jgi:hypothetical protein
MNTHTLIISTAFAVMLCMNGCGKAEEGLATHPYDVSLINRSGQDLDRAGVMMGKTDVGVGILPDTKEKGHSQYPYAIPAKADVSFRTSDGLKHEVIVELAKLVPADFDGKLYFIIKPDLSMEVKAITTERYKAGDRP